jgi:hypothetical protein
MPVEALVITVARTALGVDMVRLLRGRDPQDRCRSPVVDWRRKRVVGSELAVTKLQVGGAADADDDRVVELPVRLVGIGQSEPREATMIAPSRKVRAVITLRHASGR